MQALSSMPQQQRLVPNQTPAISQPCEVPSSEKKGPPANGDSDSGLRSSSSRPSIDTGIGSVDVESTPDSCSFQGEAAAEVCTVTSKAHNDMCSSEAKDRRRPVRESSALYRERRKRTFASIKAGTLSKHSEALRLLSKLDRTILPNAMYAMHIPLLSSLRHGLESIPLNSVKNSVYTSKMFMQDMKNENLQLEDGAAAKEHHRRRAQWYRREKKKEFEEWMERNCNVSILFQKLQQLEKMVC
jgi:hypothetical protein